MSISLTLVPLALAAMGAWQAHQAGTDEQGRAVQHVQTRMRDERLLAAALTDTQAAVTRSGDALLADWHGVHAAFRRDAQGVWQVDFTGDVDQDRAVGIVVAIDQAYGRQVQQAVLARLRERAPGAGMAVSSETVEDDDSVTLVLDLVQGA